MEHESEQLIAEYAEAFAEWEGTEDAAFWENTVADGLEDEDDWAEQWDVQLRQREE
jgi:hypothetical protein